MAHDIGEFRVPYQNKLERVEEFLDASLEDIKGDIIAQIDGTPSLEYGDDARRVDIARRSQDLADLRAATMRQEEWALAA